MEYQLDEFRAGAEELGFHFTEEQFSAFLRYYEMLVEKNKVMNLTAITDFDEVVRKHFLDSLSLSRICDLSKKKGVHLLDLGTGAGFPGIPLKIAYPELEITLLDSLNKRVLFLKEVISDLGLKKIDALHGRAEEMARKKEYREKYDYVVSRAVANLSTLSEYCIPFVKERGAFISYKSGQVEEELSESKYGIKLLGAQLEKIEQFEVPNTKISRSLILIRKKEKTPKAYPRKAGTPSKEPLKK